MGLFLALIQEQPGEILLQTRIAVKLILYFLSLAEVPDVARGIFKEIEYCNKNPF